MGSLSSCCGQEEPDPDYENLDDQTGEPEPGFSLPDGPIPFTLSESEKNDPTKIQLRKLTNELQKSRMKVKYCQEQMTSMLDMPELETSYDADETSTKSITRTLQNAVTKLQVAIRQQENKDISDLVYQINILNDDGLRVKSLLLLTFIEVEATGSFYSFMVKFLNSTTSFNKTWSTVDETGAGFYTADNLRQFFEIVAIIYEIKIYQAKNVDKRKPKINKLMIRQQILHLTVWILRNYGKVQVDQVGDVISSLVTYMLESGELAAGEFKTYEMMLSKQEVKDKLGVWIQRYIECQGAHQDSQLVVSGLYTDPAFVASPKSPK